MLLAGRCLWRRHAEPNGSAAQSFDSLAPGPALGSDLALGSKAVALGLVPPDATAARVAELLAAFRANNFGVLDSLLHVVGAACYPSTALLNHSCTPNCVLVFRGARLSVTTIKDIAAGEERWSGWWEERHVFNTGCFWWDSSSDTGVSKTLGGPATLGGEYRGPK